MSVLSHPYLLGSGIILVVIGYLLRSWASRHDLMDLAKDAAWQVAKNKGNLAAANESEIGQKFKDLQGDASNAGRAKKAAGYAARHAMAQVAGIGGLISLLIGACLIGAAFYLK
jgi:hypothetical protein